MIGLLKGILVDFQEGLATIDVQGVGYEVLTSVNLNAPINQELSLYIHTHVREDTLTLFGFGSRLEKNIFQKLIKVSGIGAKTAILVLSQFDPEQLISIIAGKDSQSLCAVKGIGKKAAEKIILELASTIHKVFGTDLIPKQIKSLSQPLAPESELVSALTNLGYKRHDIDRALTQIDFETHVNFDQQFKASLKHLSQ